MEVLFAVSVIFLRFIFVDPSDVGTHYEDRLSDFLKTLESEMKTGSCPDRSLLMPDCSKCIPGLMRGNNPTTCDKLIRSTVKIRAEIKKLTAKRFMNTNPRRQYALYPYLETPEFVFRQEMFGKMISASNATVILDIGWYYNPINLFFQNNFCPKSVVINEPILEPLSRYVPCGSSSEEESKYHLIIAPFPFLYFPTAKVHLPIFDTVVCIGCDSIYGPSRTLLETSFQRPYTLYLEYPEEYVHNAAFNKMLGEGPGEKLLYMEKFIVNSTRTEYVKRVMKIISYS